MDAKTYAAAVALILVGVGVGYVLMGPFPETTEAQISGGQYDPPHSSQVSFWNDNYADYGQQYQSFWKEGNRVTSDCIHQSGRVIFYDYDMNVIAQYDMSGDNEGTLRSNSADKCGHNNLYPTWIDTELPQEPVRVGVDYGEYGIRTF
mgnify:CR=1 FL=1